jgi:oligopeptide transport system substrate-binding protein
MTDFTTRRRLLVSASALAAAGATGTIGLAGGCAGRREAPADTLRVALGGGPDSLDPLRAEFAAAALLFRQYMSPVVAYGAGGSPAPGVAQRWAADDGYRRWTFTIADGLTFSDDTPITAETVRDTLRWAATKTRAYPDASEYFAIKGFREAVVDGADPATISVEAPDASTLVVSLVAPDAHFPERLQEFYPCPLHVMAADPDGWTRPETIVVSGPFKPVERTQTRLVFEANPKGGWVEGMPARIDVETVDDAATRLRMFQSGDVDLAQDPPQLRATEFAERFGTQYRRVAAPRIIYMSMNTKREVLADPEVRRALAMSINREMICTGIMRGSVEPAGRFVRGEAQPAYDPDGARAILAARGFTPDNPLRFELLVTKDDRERAAIQMISDWKAVGADVTLFAADASAIVARLNGFEFDAAIVRLDKGMKSDPLDLMASWATGGTAYSHQWRDPAFDARLEAVRAEADDGRRKALLLEAEAMLLEACPVTGIWFFPSAWFVAERVTGGIEGVPPIIWPSLRLAPA